jgi:uncharacterized protein (TIGR03437 family)
MLSTLRVLLAACAIVAATRAQGIITTVAGTDLLFSAQGKPGQAVPLGRLQAVTVDPQNRAVFADPYYNLIVRVEADGTLRVIAGNNVQGLSAGMGTFAASGGGFSGDGGPATSAALNRPAGVAYDSQGNLYIADTFNNRIRVVGTDGVITTLAGSGVPGYQDGPTSGAQFNLPQEITVDSSNAVYVNDYGNYVIRKIFQGRVSTVAGTANRFGPTADGAPALGSALNIVRGLVIDTSGVIYFAEYLSNRVRKIGLDGRLVTVAGTGQDGALGDNGPPLSASIVLPAGLALDSKGTLYVGDLGHDTVRMIANGKITTAAGVLYAYNFSGDGGRATAAGLHYPLGLAVTPAGTLYIADRDSFRIRGVDLSSGKINTVAGNGNLLYLADAAPALYAPLLQPFGVTTDPGGNLFIADTGNQLIRKFSATARTIATIAGNGAEEDGDPGPATQQGLANPFSANIDPSGNLLIADEGNSVVRKVVNGNSSVFISGLNQPVQAVTDANGNTYVSEFASNQIRVMRRDGTVRAFKTGLQGPFGLALDDAGNLYIAEWSGAKVTKILPDGTTVPIAGGGTVLGTDADGRSALTAKLLRPAGVAVDSGRNVYFTDAADNRVRRVTPGGIISTIAGNGTTGYAGDGGLSTRASLHTPLGVAVDNATGTIYVSDTVNNRIRAIQTVGPGFSTSTTDLSFTVYQDGPVSDTTTVGLVSASFGHLGGLLFAASASKPWISVTPGTASMPATLQVSVDPTGLTPQTFHETITINAPGANPPSARINVTINVLPAAPPKLSIDADPVINIGFVAGADAVTRRFHVSNSGGGQAQFNVTAQMDNGSGWLSVSSSANSATASNPATVTITISPNQLDAGSYTGAIVVNPDTDNLRIPINIGVSGKRGKLLLSSTVLKFTVVKGGSAPLSQDINLVNTGSGSLPWTASASVLSGGSWLKLDASSGSVDTPLTGVSTLHASIDMSSLDPNIQTGRLYYGQVTIDSSAASNAPQLVNLELNVVDASANAGPDVSASGLVFKDGSQTSNPGSQTVTISNIGTQDLSFGSTRSSDDGNWFVQVPTDAVIPAGSSLKVVVQPDYSKLSAGPHRGTMSLRFSNGATRDISILGIVSSSSVAAGGLPSADHLTPRDAHSCTPENYVVTITKPQANATVPVNASMPVEVSVTDGCGKTVNSLPKSSNNQALAAIYRSGVQIVTIPLSNTSDGVWTGSWTPSEVYSNFVAKATADGLVNGKTAAVGYTQVQVAFSTVSPAVHTPAVSPAGILNAASLKDKAPVAPCSLITIKGSDLADDAASSGIPYQTSLANAFIKFGNKALPLLYASKDQVNAQVPCDLSMDTTLQLSVQRGDIQGPLVEFAVAKAYPAVFTKDESGSGLGDIRFAGTYTYAAPSQPGQDARPATAGDFVTIYCNGLGPVQNPLSAGVPADSPDPTVETPVVTINGQNVPVIYSGLSLGVPGRYQIDIQVPSGITPSDAVPVTVAISGFKSPTVYMAIQ